MSPIDSNGFNDVDVKTLITNKGSAKEPGSYYVRMWCRTETGESACVIVYDAMSTFYQRLRNRQDRHTGELLCEQIQNDVTRRFQLHLGLQVSIVEKHSSNGWEHEPNDPEKCKLHAWMRFDCGSPDIKTGLSFGKCPL